MVGRRCAVSPPDLRAEEPPDRLLVDQARRGGAGARAAYDQLIARHKDWLFTYLLRLLGDAGSADDAAQETFLRAWLAIGRLKSSERFRPWLRTIATRTAFNLRRSGKTRGRYEEAAPPPGHLPSPRELVETEELLLVVLDQLPYPYREVLVLRYLEEQPLAEIQAHLDIGSSALKMRLKRARDAFLELWERHGDEQRDRRG